MVLALSLLGGLLLIAAIIAANGYFVAQEFAFITVDRARLESQAERGDRVAERMLRVTRRTSFMLSGAQLGITVTGLLVGYVAEPLVGNAVGTLLGTTGVSTTAGVAIGTVGVLVASTFVQMLFGELFPKNLAIARPHQLARWLSASTMLYLRLAGWLIWVFDRASAGLLRLLRIEPVHDVEHAASPRDLQRIVAASRQAGELPAELSLLLDRVLDFPDRDVEHALVPRSRVDVLDEHATLAEVRETMSRGHSRYPVLNDDGEIAGVVHLVDVLDAIAEGTATDERPVTEIARPATVIPTLMPLPEAVTAMAESRGKLACAVDEYGGFAGIVTAEDLAEELVGELTDEHDVDEQPHLLAADTDGQRWWVRGDAPLDEVERELAHVLPRGDYETVSGLVIANHGTLPAENAVIDIDLPGDPVELAHQEHPPNRVLRATVTEIEQHVPALLTLELLDDPPNESPTTAGEQPTDPGHEES
ncbi:MULTISPECIES: hemolysin family protein [unclassified Actinopolyspora]|uniref:CNNM domain-containing protein n=1 Tax=unclassified Actinopolyspora TaxID=2639451 RepID=UPI0013F63A2B|nr:HlyC/CorC family transporter [Actinopolyspora sp. BKK2]NHE78688.1 HlyC/CorC family transporter [Actinopolyspora sp. BKK1]